MKLILSIVMTCMLLTTPVHSNDLFVYDLGDGNYVATTNREIGEWIVVFYYWIQDTFGEDECIYYGH